MGEKYALYTLICVFWIALVVLFRKYGNRKVIVHRQVPSHIDVIKDGPVDYREQKMVIQFSPENGDVDYELFYDICVHIEDVLSGTYKVPLKFTKGHVEPFVDAINPSKSQIYDKKFNDKTDSMDLDTNPLETANKNRVDVLKMLNQKKRKNDEKND